MSPTSYQAAPPREFMIANALSNVKRLRLARASRRQRAGSVQPHASLTTNCTLSHRRARQRQSPNVHP
jgi:hypothetical protein